MIREIMVGIALVIIILCANAIYQNIHCGTPVCQADPLQIIPCEPAYKLEVEIAELTRRARENPAQ